MKKFLALALSVMITTAGVPAYADVAPEKAVIEEINLDQELGMLISEALGLYLELDDEDDQEFRDELEEKLEAGLNVILRDDLDEEKEDSIKSLEVTLSEDEGFENDWNDEEYEMTEEQEELLEKIDKLEETLENDELSEEEVEKIEEKLKGLYEEFDEMEEDFEEDDDDFEDE